MVRKSCTCPKEYHWGCITAVLYRQNNAYVLRFMCLKCHSMAYAENEFGGAQLGRATSKNMEYGQLAPIILRRETLVLLNFTNNSTK